MAKQIVLIHFLFCVIVLTSYEVHSKIFNPLRCFSNNITYTEYKIQFYFSSRNQYVQNFTNLVSDNVDFVPKRRTVVQIHGLTPWMYPEKTKNLRDKLIQWGDINIIEVDWNEGCKDALAYVQAAVNTEWAAISIKNLLMHTINAWKGTSKSVEYWGPIHFIGHSLGAHVAGQTAELMKQNGILIDRVTGLDPAGPCFHDPNSRLRLKPSNARFVDAIHTDGGVLHKFQFGLLDPVGHIDFYVNGGRIQPGCLKLKFKRETINLRHLLSELIPENGLCQHLRAYPVFAATLDQASTNGCKFWGIPWNSADLATGEPRPSGIHYCSKERGCIEMGINTEYYRNARGIFYVETTRRWPFCNL